MLRGITAKRSVITALVFFFTIAVSIGTADDPVQPLIEGPCPQADLSGDCFVDFLDMAILANQWLQRGCPDDYVDCDDLLENGCEINIASDVNNCGECDYICPTPAHGTAGCQDGNCIVANCNFGWGNCDGNPANGCETNIASDITNCGWCGYSCPPPSHGTAGCQNGSCIVASCDAGWGNCDGNPSNGCETNIYTNVNHCGSCGHPCNLPNATPACSGGNCIISSCNFGYADCDGNPANGCEINLNDGGGSCAAALYLGSVCGDEYSGTFCSTSECQVGPSYNGRGEKWLQVYLDECESAICDGDLHIWVRLQSPSGIDYDLAIYSPCGTLLDYSSNGTGLMDEVDYIWEDTTGSDGRYVYIEVSYYGGSSCSTWSLQTWGGCPTGP